MGNQAGIIIRNVKNELFHSAKRLILNEVKGIECLHTVYSCGEDGQSALGRALAATSWAKRRIVTWKRETE